MKTKVHSSCKLVCAILKTNGIDDATDNKGKGKIYSVYTA